MPSKRRGINRQQITKKDAAKDDFFGIDEGRSSAHWGLHILAGVVCVIFAIWVWMLNPTPQIHPDQMNIVTMVLSKEHPDNFARDLIYGGKAADFYPALPRAIIGGLIRKFGIIGGHRVAQFPLSVAYLFVMYGTLYYLTRSVPAALLVTLASLIWRWSLGGTYWGLDRLQAVQPRGFVVIFAPMLLVLFWRLRDSRWLLAPFFILGLLFNLNPPSSLFFAALIWPSLLLVNLRNRRGIVYLIFGAVVFILGALPYVCTNMIIRSQCSVSLSGQALEEHINVMQYRFRQTAWFPFPASFLARAFMHGFSVPLLLGTIAWCLRKERRNMFDKWLVCFLLLAFVGTVIAQYIMQQIYIHFKIAPVLANCMRGQKFAYLVLYIYVAWLLAELLRQFTLRDRCVLITVVAMIVAIMPPFGNNSRDPWGQWDYNASQMNALLQGEKIEIAGWHRQIANICAWAQQKTPKDSLFLFVHRFMSPFRIYALRSLVTAQSGGGYARFTGPKAIITWAKYQRELEWITARNDVPRLLKLADESRADYIIVPNGFPNVTGWHLEMRDRFWTVYKKTAD
jgi:hypothetical protein